MFSLAGANSVSARDDGRYADSPLKAWFDKLASQKGLCCSVTDGLQLNDVDWDTQGGHYRVRIDGVWIIVPDAAIVPVPNRAGFAIVWPYKDESGNVQIRCFLAGAGT